MNTKYVICKNTEGNEITFVTDETRAKIKKSRGEAFNVVSIYATMQEAHTALADLKEQKKTKKKAKAPLATPAQETPQEDK